MPSPPKPLEFGVQHVALTDPASAARARQCPARMMSGSSRGDAGLVDLSRPSKPTWSSSPSSAPPDCARPRRHRGRHATSPSPARKSSSWPAESSWKPPGAKAWRVLPVDSEHNAIFQCLEGRDPAEVSRLILTASGGPFRTWPRRPNRHRHPRPGAEASHLGTWAGRSPSTPPRSSTKAWK